MATQKNISYVPPSVTLYLIYMFVLFVIGYNYFVNLIETGFRYIKMSSPHLNNLIIIGTILTYLSVIFLGLDSRLTSVQVFPYVCTARAWLLMAGFSLAFGAMFSKTWRVHSIFTDVKLNKKVIKDYQLFMVVGVLLVIDLIIMTTWQITDPFFRDTKLMEPFPHPHSEDIIIYPENEYCISHQMNIFVGIIYAYKGLLMLFGAFLAWETRHVSIPALNDSKYVGMSVYNVVLICVMGVAISFVLSDQQNISFILISTFIIFCATITLCLVFVPKVVELRRNPQGVIDKRVRATLKPMERRDSGQLEEQMKEAKGENQRCRKLLMEREAELQSLLTRLGDSDRIPINQQEVIPVPNSQPAPIIPQPQPQSVPPTLNISPLIALKKEVPSGTETTEVTSICSLENSEHDNGCYNPITNNHISDAPKPRKKSLYSPPPSPVDSTRDDLIENDTISDELPKKLHSPASQGSVKVVSWDECGGGSGRLRRRSSAAQRPVQTPPPERRTSIPGRRTPTFVHQDELWLTQRHHRNRCPNPSEDDSALIQRSVSERTKCCPHDGTMTIGRAIAPGHCTAIQGQCATLAGHCATAPRPLKKPTPAHVQSTPNVHASLTEGELLDLSILPIFQKLLTERKGAAIASCPNIAIKCDIVEYL